MSSTPTFDDEQVAEYLGRIGCARPAVADATALARLHRAHLMAVPFENLDIHLGVPIELDVNAFFDKIVRRRRGGYCYELNGSFATLLRSLGYQVELLQARVVGDGVLGIPFDHLCLLVDGVHPMLADVGFGTSFVEPVPFEFGVEHTDETGTYAVAEPAATDPQPDDRDEQWSVLRRNGAASYEFSAVPRRLTDFEPGSEHHQTSPDSHFTQNTICSLPTVGGRRTIRGRTVISTTGEQSTRRELERIEEMVATYRDDFGIDLDDEEYVTLWEIGESR